MRVQMEAIHDVRRRRGVGEIPCCKETELSNKLS